MNISTENIAGYANMTPEQQRDALLSLELPDMPDMSKYVKKELFDGKASELAKVSKQLKERMSDEELKAQESAEKEAQSAKMISDLQEQCKGLIRQNTIATHVSRFIAMPGYTPEMAKETAEALADGNMDVVFANQQKANAEHEKQLKAQWIKDTPHPNGNNGNGGNDPAMEMAKKLGSQKSDGMKSRDDVMKYYK